MVCPACKAANASENRACSSCGAALPERPAIRNAGVDDEAGQATVVVRQRVAEEDEKTIVKPGRGVGLGTGPGGSAGEEAMNLAPDSLLAGRYKIICRIGEGGMGAVYKAHDLEVDRIVAIKVIRPELAADPEILRRFKQELVLARQVTHRNVARVFDLGAARSLKFISMEMIDGAELADLIREQGAVEPRRAARIILQICQGLEAAHAEGVVHRDLKPQNVMIDAQGRVVVMDFGIAHFVGRYGLGRAYLAAGLFPDADAEFDVCLKRRGEAAAVFLDDDPSLRYLPPVYYYRGRALEGLKSAGAAEAYKAFLAFKKVGEEDSLITDARQRLK